MENSYFHPDLQNINRNDGIFTEMFLLDIPNCVVNDVIKPKTEILSKDVNAQFTMKHLRYLYSLFLPENIAKAQEKMRVDLEVIMKMCEKDYTSVFNVDELANTLFSLPAPYTVDGIPELVQDVKNIWKQLANLLIQQDKLYDDDLKDLRNKLNGLSQTLTPLFSGAQSDLENIMKESLDIQIEAIELQQKQAMERYQDLIDGLNKTQMDLENRKASLEVDFEKRKASLQTLYDQKQAEIQTRSNLVIQATKDRMNAERSTLQETYLQRIREQTEQKQQTLKVLQDQMNQVTKSIANLRKMSKETVQSKAKEIVQQLHLEVETRFATFQQRWKDQQDLQRKASIAAEEKLQNDLLQAKQQQTTMEVEIQLRVDHYNESESIYKTMYQQFLRNQELSSNANLVFQKTLAFRQSLLKQELQVVKDTYDEWKIKREQEVLEYRSARESQLRDWYKMQGELLQQQQDRMMLRIQQLQNITTESTNTVQSLIDAWSNENSKWLMTKVEQWDQEWKNKLSTQFFIPDDAQTRLGSCVIQSCISYIDWLRSEVDCTGTITSTVQLPITKKQLDWWYNELEKWKTVVSKIEPKPDSLLQSLYQLQTSVVAKPFSLAAFSDSFQNLYCNECLLNKSWSWLKEMLPLCDPDSTSQSISLDKTQFFLKLSKLQSNWRLHLQSLTFSTNKSDDPSSQVINQAIEAFQKTVIGKVQDSLNVFLQEQKQSIEVWKKNVQTWIENTRTSLTNQWENDTKVILQQLDENLKTMNQEWTEKINASKNDLEKQLNAETERETLVTQKWDQYENELQVNQKEQDSRRQDVVVRLSILQKEQVKLETGLWDQLKQVQDKIKSNQTSSLEKVESNSFELELNQLITLNKQLNQALIEIQTTDAEHIQKNFLSASQTIYEKIQGQVDQVSGEYDTFHENAVRVAQLSADKAAIEYQQLIDKETSEQLKQWNTELTNIQNMLDRSARDEQDAIQTHANKVAEIKKRYQKQLKEELDKLHQEEKLMEDTWAKRLRDEPETLKLHIQSELKQLEDDVHQQIRARKEAAIQTLAAQEADARSRIERLTKNMEDEHAERLQELVDEFAAKNKSLQTSKESELQGIKQQAARFYTIWSSLAVIGHSIFLYMTLKRPNTMTRFLFKK